MAVLLLLPASSGVTGLKGSCLSHLKMVFISTLLMFFLEPAREAHRQVPALLSLQTKCFEAPFQLQLQSNFETARWHTGSEL